MANICFTEFLFHGLAEEISDFYNKLKDWTSRPIGESLEADWYGNILWGAELQHLIGTFGGNGAVRCAASIVSVEDYDDLFDGNASFRVFVESKWTPMGKMWEAVIQKLGYKTVKFAYRAEEPGSDIYQLYDPNRLGMYADPYYITAYLAEEPEEVTSHFKDFAWDGESDLYFESEERLVEFLQKLLNSTSATIEDLRTELETHKFESMKSYMDIHELDIIQELVD